MAATEKEKIKALSEAIAILDQDGLLTLDSIARRTVIEYIYEMIDRLGPERALEQINATKAHLIAQIHQMVM